MEDEAKFDEWAIVDVLGHQRYVGKVTEQTIAGKGFVRVDVPENGETSAWTKLIGPGSIHTITPVSEEIARSISNRLQQKPVQAYELSPRLTSDSFDDEEEPF